MQRGFAAGNTVQWSSSLTAEGKPDTGHLLLQSAKGLRCRSGCWFATFKCSAAWPCRSLPANHLPAQPQASDASSGSTCSSDFTAHSRLSLPCHLHQSTALTFQLSCCDTLYFPSARCMRTVQQGCSFTLQQGHVITLHHKGNSTPGVLQYCPPCPQQLTAGPHLPAPPL